MKILHLNTGQSGGAAWCSMRICQALSVEGVDSRMLFANGDKMPEGIEGEIACRDKSIWNSNRKLRMVKNLLVKLPLSWPMDAEKLRYQLQKANTSRLYLHQPLSEYKNIARHPLVEWADIIHLHWVPDFVDYPTFFKSVKKPIVWTLHDKYPAVGVQHYCSEFYPVPEKLKRIDKLCRKIKREGVLTAQSLNIVALSETMVEICQQSEVLKGFPISMIHNGVDVNVFQPYDKIEARKSLGLPIDAKVFLFSAYGIADKNKGLDRIIETLNRLKLANKLLVCIGGFSMEPIPECSFPIILTGLLRNQTKVAKYYSAADFFFQCSYEETFAQTPLEAMACGTPVISTPCSGAKDLIRPLNGIVCGGFDSPSITKGIEHALAQRYDSAAIRRHIVENYQYDKIARQYIALYDAVIRGQKMPVDRSATSYSVEGKIGNSDTHVEADT